LPFTNNTHNFAHLPFEHLVAKSNEDLDELVEETSNLWHSPMIYELGELQ
jgi:hypothetical protein